MTPLCSRLASTFDARTMTLKRLIRYSVEPLSRSPQRPHCVSVKLLRRELSTIRYAQIAQRQAKEFPSGLIDEQY
jgi:hypothetical protein